MADGYRVGIIWTGFPQPWQEPLLQRLRDRYTVVPRYARGAGAEVLRAFATELLAEHAVDLIVAGDTPAAIAAQAATSVVPIVVAASADCVSTGLVKNPRQPEGNTTGLTSHGPDDARLLVLVEVLEANRRAVSPVAVLWNQDNPAKRLEYEKTRTVAHELSPSVEIRSLPLSGPDYAFAAAFQPAEGANALVLLEDPVTVQHRQAIVELARAYELPAIYESRPFVEIGGLMALGADRFAAYALTAECAERILDNGLRAGHLPAVEELKMDLVVSQRVARELGLSRIPDTLAGYRPKFIG
jgi:putative ABC transport system substrate-binding protein